MQYWLVVPAAGSGRRFGDAVPKQYAALAGRTVLEWSLDAFLNDTRCRAIVVALARDDVHWPRIARGMPAKVHTVEGGAERADSVRRGLDLLLDEARADDWVLVHDAARPCLARADLDRLLGELRVHAVGGLLAVRQADTLKRADDDGSVIETVPREALWRAATPQMFRFGALRAALHAAHTAGRKPTDEAQALEWQGGVPRVVECATSNIKVTSAEDLALAEALLARRRRAS